MNDQLHFHPRDETFYKALAGRATLALAGNHDKHLDFLKYLLSYRTWLLTGLLRGASSVLPKHFAPFYWRRFPDSPKLSEDLGELPLSFHPGAYRFEHDDTSTVGDFLGLSSELLERVLPELKFQLVSGAELESRNVSSIIPKLAEHRTIVLSVSTNDDFFEGCRMSLGGIADVLQCERILVDSKVHRLESEAVVDIVSDLISNLKNVSLVLATVSSNPVDEQNLADAMQDLHQRGFVKVQVYGFNTIQSEGELLGISSPQLFDPEGDSTYQHPSVSNLEALLANSEDWAEDFVPYFGAKPFGELAHCSVSDCCTYLLRKQEQQEDSAAILSLSKLLDSLGLGDLLLGQKLSTLSSAELFQLELLHVLRGSLSEVCALIDLRASSLSECALLPILIGFLNNQKEIHSTLLFSRDHSLGKLVDQEISFETKEQEEVLGGPSPYQDNASEELYVEFLCQDDSSLEHIAPNYGEFYCLSGGPSSGKTLVLNSLFKKLDLPGVQSNLQKVSGINSTFASASGLSDILIAEFLRTVEVKKFGFTKADFTKKLLCKRCKGHGYILEDILPVRCEECSGAGCQEELKTLEIDGLSFGEFSQATPNEILSVMKDREQLRSWLSLLVTLGFGNVSLIMPVRYLEPLEKARLAFLQSITANSRMLFHSPGKTRRVYLLDDPLLGLRSNFQNAVVRILQQLATQGHALFCTDSTGILARSASKSYRVCTQRVAPDRGSNNLPAQRLLVQIFQVEDANCHE